MSKKRDPNALQDEARNLPKHSASKSRLLPHLATIRILREKRYTWRAIAKWLSERGCRISASALHEFVARIDKSAVMSGIAEYLNHQRVPVQMIDCDTENKSKGSLSYFYNGQIQKVDIRKPTGLDAFVELAVDNNAPVVLADLGAGSGVDVYA